MGREEKTINRTKTKQKKLTYREKVENDMRAYDKQHPERRRNDNYTIALRNEARRQSEEMMKRQLASMALMPVVGLGFPIALGNMYVSTKRGNTIKEIMDEYNIQEAKRVLNM